jgi:L-aminopeptidase/D-esterase-like protein
VGKVLGRERATRGGVGYATVTVPSAPTALSGPATTTEPMAPPTTMAALAVANSFGDVVAQDGALLGAPRDYDGKLIRTIEVIKRTPEPPNLSRLLARAAGNTTLVCVHTDASLDKRSCAILARMASAGIPRAVDPAFTQLDGDVVFFLASGAQPPPPPGLVATWSLTAMGALAAAVTAAAIRDAVSPEAQHATGPTVE